MPLPAEGRSRGGLLSNRVEFGYQISRNASASGSCENRILEDFT